MRTPGTVEVVTFGCRLNAVESDAMRVQALRAGYRDLTIVNTCAVTAEASRQARQAIRRLRRERPERRIVVTGCASETEAALFGAMPDVDAIIPNARKTLATAWHGLASPPSSPAGASAPHQPKRSRGFVEVQNGCDHRCTFCIIPFGRGASRSVAGDAVVARCQELIATGAREIVLTGVDVTSYGSDLPSQPHLGALVRDILRHCPELPRLRLSSLDCVEADPVLLDLFATEPRLMPHLHLSLQAGSDLILKRMKRRHGRDDAIAFCARLRGLRPDIVFGADFIVGFPTETEAQFRDTLALIEDAGLTYIHSFPFSSRPGTPAARMPAVPGPIVKERAQRLRFVAEQRMASHLASKVGCRTRVLTEQGAKARAADFTLVRLPDAVEAGRFFDVDVTGHDGTALIAQLA